MAGILDKIKGMFAGAKDKATADGGGLDAHDDKAGDKVPDQVHDTYDKGSDKVEEVIPGDHDADGK